MIIDLFEFTRNQETVSGQVGWARLARVDTPARDGSLAWTARGSIDARHGTAGLDLQVSGVATLICQRCLQPMQEPIAITTRFLVASDEESADELDQDDDHDVVVGSATFDLDALIEDEVILALPSAPRHGVCPDGAGVTPAPATKPSPFAALAGLRSDATARSADEDG